MNCFDVFMLQIKSDYLFSPSGFSFYCEILAVIYLFTCLSSELESNFNTHVSNSWETPLI